MSAPVLGSIAVLIGVVTLSIPIIITLLVGKYSNATTNTNSILDAERKESKCDICNERMEIDETTYTLPCKHKFHGICLQMVYEAELENSATCPYIDCRRWVRPEIRRQIFTKEFSF